MAAPFTAVAADAAAAASSQSLPSQPSPFMMAPEPLNTPMLACKVICNDNAGAVTMLNDVDELKISGATVCPAGWDAAAASQVAENSEPSEVVAPMLQVARREQSQSAAAFELEVLGNRGTVHFACNVRQVVID